MKPAYLLVLLLTQSPWAVASDTDLASDGIVTARAHFLRGVDLYRAGAYDAALAEFSRAYEAAPNYRILYNLAQLQAQRQDYVASIELFHRYLEDGGADISPARLAEVTGELSVLERRVARLHVECNVAQAQLFLNDGAPAELPQHEPLWVNASIHRLRVEKPGYRTAFRTVTLTGGDELRLTVDLTREPSADPPRRPLALADTPPLAPAPDRTAVWAGLAATGAFAAAALTFGLLTHGANAELDRQLGDDPAPRGSIDATRERIGTYVTLTDSFAIAAAAALGVTAYIHFSTPDTQTTSAGPRLHAQIGPRGSQVWWVGDF